MAYAEWRQYKGKDIFVESYKDEKNTEEILRVCRLAQDLVVNSGKKDILALGDITNGHYNREIIEAFKIQAKAQKPYIKKNAVIGLTPVKKLLVNMVSKVTGLELRGFETEQEALEWLIEE